MSVGEQGEATRLLSVALAQRQVHTHNRLESVGYTRANVAHGAVEPVTVGDGRRPRARGLLCRHEHLGPGGAVVRRKRRGNV